MTTFPKATAFALAISVLLGICRASQIRYFSVSEMPDTPKVAQNILTKLLTNACKKYAGLGSWTEKPAVSRLLNAFDGSDHTNLLVFLKDCNMLGDTKFLKALTESAQETLEEEVTDDVSFNDEQMEKFKNDTTSSLRDIASDISTNDFVRTFMDKGKFDPENKDTKDEIKEIAEQLSEEEDYQPLFEEFREAIAQYLRKYHNIIREAGNSSSDSSWSESSDSSSSWGESSDSEPESEESSGLYRRLMCAN